ncbi:hypothetical protein TNCV_888851 [Trichonephila clavipes]|nr:hypothetical protein TNCV_888851 [Trichonephila clavipes]
MNQTVFLGDRSVFQDDNAPVHTSRCDQTLLHEPDDEMGYLTWCLQSPDLNIIECFCYNLKKRPPPQPRIEITTVGDLYAYLEAEKMRYVTAKCATTSASMGTECYM